MIDLSLPKTWPPAILELLARTAAETRKEMEAELAAQLNGSHWRNPPACHAVRQTRESLESLIQNYDIRAFHCTRLLDPDSVLRQGLELLSSAIIKPRVLAALERAGVGKELLADASRAFANCEAVGDYAHRQGMLWFVLSEESTNKSGCAAFFRYFGGEITRHALDGLAEDLFPVLASIGTPCVVAAQLPIRDAPPHHLSAMANEFIRFSQSWFLDHTHYAMQCDMMIRYSVKPERILAVWGKPLG